MRSWVLSIIGISSLVCAISATAIGQGGIGGGTTRPTPPASKSPKEIRFKLEWITTTVGANPTKESESVVLSAVEGETTMTSNGISGSNNYRRVTIHPELQPDGSYAVSLGVSEVAKDQERDIPRLDTTVLVKSSETKVVQARVSKGSNYQYEYLFTITPGVE